MKTSLIISMVAIAGIAFGFAACTLLKKTTKRPEGEVDKVPYADKILLHMHPEKFLPFLPNLSDHQIAYLYGMNLSDYQRAKNDYQDQARAKADELLADPLIAESVDRLPFRKNQKILVLGESTADALNSWVYILQFLMEKRRPNDHIEVINAAVSGQTTTEAIRKITGLVKQKPDWVLCHLGANDCMRYGGVDKKTTVSISETLKNLRLIRGIITTETKAKILWIAPAPVHEEKIASFPPFKNINLNLKNNDILAIGDSISTTFAPVLDLRNDIGVPAKADYVQFDGGHLTAEGQAVVVKALLSKLSERAFTN
jgi:acyl-CoA thioesterase I